MSIIKIEKRFKIKEVPNFTFKFKKNILFSNKKSNNKIHKVPNLFFYIFYFYSKQNYKISKLILKDFKITNKKKINFSKNLSLLFIKFLKKK